MEFFGFRSRRKRYKVTYWERSITFGLTYGFSWCVRRVSLVAIGLGLALGVSSPLLAQQNDEPTSLFDLNLSDLMEVQVVTAAAGFAQNVKDAPASVSVIEAEEWQAAGARNVLEAIKRIPGVHISFMQTGATIQKPIIRGLSGTFGQQVLLLVDGVPLKSVREGGAPWSAYLSLNSFKRIEVIRGSGSAVYGADAVGGIINLVSYEPGEVAQSVSVAGGQDGYAAFEISKAFEVANNQFNLAWSSQKSDGDPDRVIDADLQTLFDSGFGTNASLAPGEFQSRFKSHTFNLSWRYGNWTASYMDGFYGSVGTGAGVSQALDPVGEIEMRTQFAKVAYDFSQMVPGEMRLLGTWQKVDASVDSVLFPPGGSYNVFADGNLFPSFTPQPGWPIVTFTDGVKGKPENVNHLYSLQLNHIFDLANGHKLRWALGAEHLDNHTLESKNFGPGAWQGETVVDGTMHDVSGTEDTYLPNVDRDVQYISVQDQWLLNDQWTATLGVRYDHYSDFGSTTNPRLGLLWRTSENITIKAFAGSAFRAPSFVDYYAQNNPAGLGNDNLDPESVNLVDLGLSANYIIFDNLQLETSLYQYSADKLVAFELVEGLGNVAQNSGLLKVRGLEQQVNWHSGNALSINFNFTYLDPYQTENVDVSAVPKCLANLNFYYRLNRFNWYVGAKWVGGRDRHSEDPRDEVDDYLWLDGRVDLDIGPWNAGINVDNLLDVDAHEPSSIPNPSDYPLAGRQIRLQITRSF